MQIILHNRQEGLTKEYNEHNIGHRQTDRQTDRQTRDISLDYAKGIGIFLVILGHAICYTDCSNDARYINHIIYSFHMPLFFMISGMLLYKKINSTEIIRKKEATKMCNRLLIPYFTWSFIYLLPGSLLHGGISWERIIAVISFRGVAPIWFLGALFFAEILFIYTIKKEYKFKKNCVIFAGIVSLSFVAQCIFNNYKDNIPFELLYLLIFVFRELLAYAFVVCGYELARLFKNHESKKIIFVLSSIGFFSIQLYTNNGVNMHTFAFENIFIFIATGILGSTLVISICDIFKNKDLHFVSNAGKNSFDLMITHHPPFPFIKIFAFLSNKLTGEIIISIIFILTLICTYTTTYFLQSVRMFCKKRNINIYI